VCLRLFSYYTYNLHKRNSREHRRHRWYMSRTHICHELIMYTRHQSMRPVMWECVNHQSLFTCVYAPFHMCIRLFSHVYTSLFVLHLSSVSLHTTYMPTQAWWSRHRHRWRGVVRVVEVGLLQVSFHKCTRLFSYYKYTLHKHDGVDTAIDHAG